jgi:hypothetical protein
VFGPISGGTGLIVSPRFASRNAWRILDARNCRLGRADIWLGFSLIRFPGRVQLVTDFILGLLKFLDR